MADLALKNSSCAHTKRRYGSWTPAFASIPGRWTRRRLRKTAFYTQPISPPCSCGNARHVTHRGGRGASSWSGTSTRRSCKETGGEGETKIFQTILTFVSPTRSARGFYHGGRLTAWARLRTGGLVKRSAGIDHFRRRVYPESKTRGADDGRCLTPCQKQSKNLFTSVTCQRADRPRSITSRDRPVTGDR